MSEATTTSTLEVQSGETVALADSCAIAATSVKSVFPIVGEISVGRELFKKTTREKARTELLVLITPSVVGDPSEMRQVTNGLKRKLSAVTVPQ